MKRKIIVILAIAMMFVLAACEDASSDEVTSKKSTKSESSVTTETALTSTGAPAGNEAEDTSYYDENGWYVEIFYNEKGLISLKTWTRSVGMPPDYTEQYEYDDNWTLISSDYMSYDYPNDYFEGGIPDVNLISRTYYKDYLVAQRTEEFKTYSKGYYPWKITEYGESYPSNINDVIVTENEVYNDSGEIYCRYVTDWLNNTYVEEHLDSYENITFSKQYIIDTDGTRVLISTCYYSFSGTDYLGCVYSEFDEYENVILEKSYNEKDEMTTGALYTYYDDHRTKKTTTYLDASYVGEKTIEYETNMLGYYLKSTYYEMDGLPSQQHTWEYYEDGYSRKNHLRYIFIDGSFRLSGREEFDEKGHTLYTESYTDEGVLSHYAQYVYYPDTDIVQYRCESQGEWLERVYFDEYGRTTRRETVSSGSAVITEYTYYDYETYLKTYDYKTCSEYRGSTVDNVIISAYWEQDELGRDTLWENYDGDGVKVSKVTETYWGDTKYRKRQENWYYEGKLYLNLLFEFNEDETHYTEKVYNPDGSLYDTFYY